MYMLKELFTDLLARKCYGQYSLMCEHDTTQEGDPRNEGHHNCPLHGEYTVCWYRVKLWKGN